MLKRLATAALAALCLAGPVHADFEDVVAAEIRPGWRLADGDHMAALHLRLAPGWKTYWRAPGDGGIPPAFDWRGSRNVAGVALIFPTPDVFFQSGLRSIGYERELVLPLRISAPQAGQDARLRGHVELGICKDVCLPHSVDFDVALPATGTGPDPVIIAALADVPFSADEAAVRAVRCRINPTKDGLQLSAEIDMPRIASAEQIVIEAGNPMVWVADPKSERRGETIVAVTELMHMSEPTFALDRSGLRFTVLGAGKAVDIHGCDRNPDP